MKSNQPIGIFDSGVGGLTVAKAVKKVLPNESIVYFGDIAHLPYGDKSTAAIQAYSVRISEMLMRKKCKVILIACNSASAAAYDLVTEYVGKKAKVFDVINPTVDYLRERYQSKRIGLIGTKRTVSSGVYSEKVKQLGLDLGLKSLATPLLVPMIEEGIYDDTISKDIIARYLKDASLNNIQALILGCTHYPIIKDAIESYYSNVDKQVEIIDSAETVAKALRGFLEFNQLVCRSESPNYEFLVSDFTTEFERITKLFFGEEVHLEKTPIWSELN